MVDCVNTKVAGYFSCLSLETIYIPNDKLSSLSFLETVLVNDIDRSTQWRKASSLEFTEVNKDGLQIPTDTPSQLLLSLCISTGQRHHCVVDSTTCRSEQRRADRKTQMSTKCSSPYTFIVQLTPPRWWTGTGGQRSRILWWPTFTEKLWRDTWHG